MLPTFPTSFIRVLSFAAGVPSALSVAVSVAPLGILHRDDPKSSLPPRDGGLASFTDVKQSSKSAFGPVVTIALPICIVILLTLFLFLLYYLYRRRNASRTPTGSRSSTIKDPNSISFKLELDAKVSSSPIAAVAVAQLPYSSPWKHQAYPYAGQNGISYQEHHTY